MSTHIQRMCRRRRTVWLWELHYPKALRFGTKRKHSRLVGQPYLTGLRKGSPSSIQNGQCSLSLRGAKISLR